MYYKEVVERVKTFKDCNSHTDDCYACRKACINPEETYNTLVALRNELCLKCGKYKEAHKGACDGCRWKDR